QTGSSVSDINCVELCFMSDFFFVSFPDALDECVNSVIFYDADCTSAESASCDSGSDYARDLPRQINQDVNFLAGNFIIIAQGDMGLIHQFTEFHDISGLQSSNSVD